MDEPGLIVVALGGNALQEPDGQDSVEADFARTARTARQLASLVARGWRLVVVHGNGPQVGNHLLRSELGHLHGHLPDLPLDVCVADTQGGMGYMVQQCLINELARAELSAVVATVITQVLVDRDDPAFADPSKPIGQVIPSDRAGVLRELGWALMEDKGRSGFRRVVASPTPLEVIEGEAIRAMVDDGILVVAGGGGGIAVASGPDGQLQGVPAVVDKDYAAALLATDLRADALVVLTNVDRVALGYGTPNETPLARMTVAEARRYQADGEFGPGSMAPKVEAVCRYVEATGRAGVIGAIDVAEDLLEREVGTRIVPDEGGSNP